MSSAASSFAFSENAGPWFGKGDPVHILLPKLFAKTQAAGYVVKSIEPDEIATRVPALGPHSEADIHGVVALGMSKELYRALGSVVATLTERMRGEFWRKKFPAQHYASVMDLSNFLELADAVRKPLNIQDCPALIMTTSGHVSIDSSPELEGVERTIGLQRAEALKMNPSPKQLSLRFPSIEMNLPISLGDRKNPSVLDRFEPLGLDGHAPLFRVKRTLSVPRPFNLRHGLETDALGFAPDEREILRNGHWHKYGQHGKQADWTVLSPTGSTLYTKNAAIDAWLFTAYDTQLRRVWGYHLHMALSPEGTLLDIDATERYVPTYLELNQVLRCAVEKAVNGALAS